jgi:DNA-binding NarL/FixJ family response regulator
MTRASRAKIEILIIDDHALVREGLKRLVDEADDVVVAGEAGSATEALALLEARPFDVAVVDINLPGKTGIELLQAIKRQWPKVQVLMLSAAPEQHYAVRAVKLGASGYLPKDGALEMLVPAIRQIAAGGKYITANVAELLANEVAATSSAEGMLTDRELEVLRLIAQGKSTSQIAQALQLSDKTVGTYRTRIQDKTGLKSNAELARYALENRLLN